MKAFVITMRGHKYSNTVADRCVQSASKFGLRVDKFWGTLSEDAYGEMEQHGLKWTWAGPKNDTSMMCPITKLYMFPYQTDDIRKKIACSMSHFRLWTHCVELKEPILILEHDSVFIRSLPDINFKGICMINDPNRATRKGQWWSKQMRRRGKNGVFSKTWVTSKDERHIPDGLAGNSAYLIKPWAAQELIEKCYEVGLWPNDAVMCQQLFPYLQEYYPFVTEVIQTRSTTV